MQPQLNRAIFFVREVGSRAPEQGTLGPVAHDRPPDFDAMVRGFEGSGLKLSVDEDLPVLG